MTLDDQGFRERFAALRREDAARTPDFARLLRRKATPRPARRVLRFATPTTAALIVVVIVAVALFRFYSRPPAGNLSITQWRSPTDFLLQTPGRQLLESVPKVGQWPDGLRIFRRPATAPHRKKS